MVPFHNIRFTDSSYSDLDNCARLALQTAIHLTELYPSHLRRHDFNRVLRDTCHALEALNILQWDYFHDTCDAAVNWLLHIKELVDPLDEDADSLLLHPSRFKTLIWLGHFGEGSIGRDFERLLCQVGDDGLVYGVIQKQLLASIITADCFISLESHISFQAHWEDKRLKILNRLEEELERYVHNSVRDRHLLRDLGDASYALDVLVRANRITLNSDLAAALYQDMDTHVQQQNRATPILSETLYCVIQLATHFRQRPDVMHTLEQFFQMLRTRYDRNELRKEMGAGYFHPLVLRALLTAYGDRLQDSMVTYLLQREVSAQGDHVALNTSLHTQRLTELLKKRTHIEVINSEDLSGGLTRAEVFRVNYRISVETVEQELEKPQPSFTPPSVVVKATKPASLIWSVQQYQQLPAAIKVHFAQHGGEPITIDSERPEQAYLFLEDLADESYRTFRTVFDDLELNYPLKEAKENLGHACRVLSNAMFDIYLQTLKPENEFVGHQLSRLYFSVLERYLISMSRREHFPHLKTWFNGFWLGEKRFTSIQYYESKLDQHKAKLKIPCLMLSHGDLHGRNVMVDNYFEHIKLIDLEKLDEYGDYIFDFAQLLEDIAIFRYVFDESYSRHLDRDGIEFPTKSTRSDHIGNRIDYPAFSSPIVTDFQYLILEELEAFAEQINDPCWRERLWLATAIKLISLVDKQTDLRRATVFYVEAIKLLDALVSHLEKDTPLPDLLFDGQHPQPDIPTETAVASVLPLVAKQVHGRIQEIAKSAGLTLNIEAVAGGKIMRYYAPTGAHPVLVMDTKHEPTKLLLACDPSDVVEILPSAQGRESNSPLRTLIRLSQDTVTETITLLERCIPKFDSNSP